MMKANDLKKIVKEKYGRIAEQTNDDNSCCCGSSCCGPETAYTVFSENYDEKNGYVADADMSLGCGIPTDFAGIMEGDHVLDLGSGAGNDCFVARAIVGETGTVTGLDLTEQMIEKSRQNSLKLNFNNVDFVLGDIEKMPFNDNSFDVVISNCVLNLVPDKEKAFIEIARVLKPGGHFCVSDVVIKGNLPEQLQHDAELYAGCVSGASELGTYLAIIKNTGFNKTEIHKQKVIALPDKLLSKYLSENSLADYKRSESGIFSITVSAEKMQ